MCECCASVTVAAALAQDLSRALVLSCSLLSCSRALLLSCSLALLLMAVTNTSSYLLIGIGFWLKRGGLCCAPSCWLVGRWARRVAGSWPRCHVYLRAHLLRVHLLASSYLFPASYLAPTPTCVALPPLPIIIRGLYLARTYLLRIELLPIDLLPIHPIPL